MSKLIDDLARSGLTEADIRKLKLTTLTKVQTKKAVNKSLISYKIPYFHITGKPLPFYRVRFLETLKGLAGKAKKQQRYSQPQTTTNHLYFPPLVKWQAIAKNTDIPIVITEGEKKAAKACKEGIPTIGLGGVWSFRSKKNKEFLIDDFKLVKWEERTVWIIYDSDLTTNENVMKAMLALSKELTNKGAYVYNGYIPEVGGDKAGIDDYLLTHTAEEFLNLPMEEYEESKSLWRLNNELAIIQNPGAIYHLPTKRLLAKQTVTDILYADVTHNVIDTDENMKSVQTVPLWIKWTCRRKHAELSYEPGKDLVLENNKLNIWSGWGVDPKKGDLKPWNILLNYIFNDEPEFKTWFVRWLAYPLQYPGTKMYSAVLLTSLYHGVGKSFIGLIMGLIYGENFSEVGQEDLESQYNHWAAGKQFILADEITCSDKRRDNDKRNSLLTRRELTVNVKYQPQYTITDHANYMYTSNHPDAMFISDKDRRMAIHEIISAPMSDSVYKTIEKWMHNSGPSALFHHLLHDVDVSNFNPHGHAIQSSTKDDMVLLSKSDVDGFVQTIKEDAEHVLMYGDIKIDRDLFTNEEVLRLYDPSGEGRTTKIALGKSLRRAGFIRLSVTMTASGSKRLWALRNTEKWRKSGGAERTANYDKSVIMFDKAKKKFAKKD